MSINSNSKGIAFLKQFLFNPFKTGAIVASSKHLAEFITDTANLKNVLAVVELGPGTGVFTEQICCKLPEKSKLIAIEYNNNFAEITQQRCPQATVICDSAVNCREHLRQIGVSQCDRIICGLPWAVFPPQEQDALLSAIVDVLSPKGYFLTFAYIHGVYLPAGKRFRRMLESAFSQVERTRIVWRNLPPAFVYVAKK